MCGDPRCASDPRHARQECRLISENRVKIKLDGRGLPHYIYSVVAALRMMDALEAQQTAEIAEVPGAVATTDGQDSQLLPAVFRQNTIAAFSRIAFR